MSHKSKSGPCRVVGHFTPQPLTPSQERARLLHKLALLEDRLATRLSYNRRFPKKRYGISPLHKAINSTKMALRRFGEV